MQLAARRKAASRKAAIRLCCRQKEAKQQVARGNQQAVCGKRNPASKEAVELPITALPPASLLLPTLPLASTARRLSIAVHCLHACSHADCRLLT